MLIAGYVSNGRSRKMNQARNATVVSITASGEGMVGDRTELVRLPQGADSTIFGGWGVRI